MPALIFDCDGVLADTERDGHLPAFNATFEHFGVPVRWDVPTYAEKVKIGGGKERMRSLLTPDFVSQAGLPTGGEDQTAMLVEWHREKTARYTRLIDSGTVPARPGIARLADEARAQGWQLAVASTSALPSVEAVLRHAVGEELSAQFRFFAGDIVARKKPAPDIYELAVRELGATPGECVVIEDSGIGVRAAVAAGLRTVVTVSGFTADDDFSGASLVVDCLGSDSEPARVLDNPFGLTVGDRVDLEIFNRLLDHPLPTVSRSASRTQ